MTTTRRSLLGAAAALAALPRGARAQAFPFTPNQRYPDPAVEILDPGFAKYRIYSSSPGAARQRDALGRGTGLLPRDRHPAVSDIPNNRIMQYDEASGRFSVFRSPSNYANGNTRDRQAGSSPASIR